MFLTKDEIARLTGRARPNTQKSVLGAMGIAYKENGIGELVVSRKHVERILGGETAEIHHQGDINVSLPNFSVIGG
jgi:hypothetical protein